MPGLLDHVTYEESCAEAERRAPIFAQAVRDTEKKQRRRRW
ncbi:hypothetical protein [Pseudonocardia zijingensis]